MSLNPICSVTDFNTALDALSSRSSSTPQQREAISKDLEFLQERLDFLLYKGTEIQITDLVACQMRLDQVSSAFKRGIQPSASLPEQSTASSTALTLTNPQHPASSIFILPAECMPLIFSKAIGNQPAPIALGTLSLVCKGWQALASLDVLWEPALLRNSQQAA